MALNASASSCSDGSLPPHPQLGKLRVRTAFSMYRLVANFLLLFALVGNLAPLARAVTLVPSHACCVRKSVHSCHDSLSSQKDFFIRNASCCSDRCGRAVETTQWARAPRTGNWELAQKVEAGFARYERNFRNANASESQSTRAPPQIPVS